MQPRTNTTTSHSLIGQLFSRFYASNKSVKSPASPATQPSVVPVHKDSSSQVLTVPLELKKPPETAEEKEARLAAEKALEEKQKSQHLRDLRERDEIAQQWGDFAPSIKPAKSVTPPTKSKSAEDYCCGFIATIRQCWASLFSKKKKPGPLPVIKPKNAKLSEQPFITFSPDDELANPQVQNMM